MDFKAFLISTLFITLLALLDQGHALKCYWCNSKHDKHCDVLKNGTNLVNCDDKVDILKPPGGVYSLCRKTVITLPTSEKRTVRTCGWVDHPNYDCYYTTTMDVKSTVCECFEDECNGALPSFTATSSITLFLSTLFITLLR